MLSSHLVEYHLGEVNHLPSSYQVVRQQSLLMICSLAGFLYATPAAAHADNQQDAVLNIMGTCYTAVFICYVATDMFFKQHIEKQIIPEDLSEIVEAPLTAKDYCRQNWIIGTCAVLSAIPFSTTALAYPINVPLPFFIAYITYILFAETILHFLPVKLTIEHPVYGALPRWGKVLLSTLMRQKKSAEELRIFDEKIRLQLTKQQWVEKIANAKDHFLASLIPNMGQIDEAQLTLYLQKTSQGHFT